jgi:hypothetical protein
VSWKAVVIGIAVVVVGLIGVRALADATLTTHVEMDPDSRMLVVVHGSTNESGEFPLGAGVESLVRFCQLEVGRDIGADGLGALDGDRFSFVFQPALDDADQRQFRGCIGDIVIDHLQASVESMDLIDS